MTTQVRWTNSGDSADNGNCAEVGAAPAVTLVRDSKNADGSVPRSPTTRWAGFLADVAGRRGTP